MLMQFLFGILVNRYPHGSVSTLRMCSLHLTHPSVHTWSSGQPTVKRPGSSRGLPVGAGIRTHNLGLPRVSSPTLYPLGQRLPSGNYCKSLMCMCDLRIQSMHGYKKCVYYSDYEIHVTRTYAVPRAHVQREVCFGLKGLHSNPSK